MFWQVTVGLVILIAVNLGFAKPTNDEQLTQYKDYSIVHGCIVRNFNFTERERFPGGFCAFLDNGSFVATTLSELVFYDRNNHVVWRHPGQYHHQLKLSRDKKSILAIRNQIDVEGTERVRSDVAELISLKGEVLASVSVRAAFEASNAKIDKRKLATNFFGDFEISHWNSIDEIEDSVANKTWGGLEKPRYVINGSRDGLFIYSDGFKKLLGNFKLTEQPGHGVHDVQFLPNNKLLMFVNQHQTAQATGEELIHSALVEIDFVSKKETVVFKANPASMFYSLANGGVQYVDGDLVFFSDMLKGAYLWSRKSQKLLRFFANPLPFVTVQDYKLVNLSDFFKTREAP